MRVLEQHGIAYTPHEYPHGKDAVDGVTVANLLGQDPDCVYKTLVARGKSGGYFVFVIPVAEELDLKKAAKAVGEKAIELVHVKELLRTLEKENRGLRERIFGAIQRYPLDGWAPDRERYETE